MAEEELFRRETDRMFAQGLNKCELGINQCNQQLSEIREAMHTGMAALNLQIAKLPVPLTLEQMETRFVLRREHDERRDYTDKAFEQIARTFVTADEIRPMKVAIYGLWASIGTAMVGAAIAYALK